MTELVFVLLGWSEQVPANTRRKVPIYFLPPHSQIPDLQNMRTTISLDILGVGNNRDFSHYLQSLSVSLTHTHYSSCMKEDVWVLRGAHSTKPRGPVPRARPSLLLPLAPISRAAPEASARLEQPVPRVSTQRCVNTPGPTSTQECLI